MNNNLVQVFRCSPIVGKVYYHAEFDTSIGKYPNTQYFVNKNKLRLVGEYIKMTRIGLGDGAQVYEHFMLDGKEITVHYSYDGRTCFLLKN